MKDERERERDRGRRVGTEEGGKEVSTVTCFVRRGMWF